MFIFVFIMLLSSTKDHYAQNYELFVVIYELIFMFIKQKSDFFCNFSIFMWISHNFLLFGSVSWKGSASWRWSGSESAEMNRIWADPNPQHCKSMHALFRFQSRYFWPSSCWAPENTDYAVYLAKRTMQHKVVLVNCPEI